MSRQKTSKSIVQDMGVDSHECGYCKHASGPNGSMAHGMWAHHMTPESYQLLIDRGWRRSGQYLYKNDLQQTCCPPYTIRLDVHHFRPNKEQRRVLRKMEAFLAGEPLQSRPGRSQAMQAEPTAQPARPQRAGVREASAAPEQARLIQLVTASLQDIQQQRQHVEVRLSEPSVKQQKHLPAGARYTCAAAHAAAGGLRKGGSAAPSAQQLAERVAEELQPRLREAGLQGWRVQAAAGHLNFFRSEQGVGAAAAQQLPHNPRHQSGMAPGAPHPTQGTSQAAAETQAQAPAVPVQTGVPCSGVALEKRSASPADAAPQQAAPEASASAVPMPAQHPASAGVGPAAASCGSAAWHLPAPHGRRLELRLMPSSPALVEEEFPLYKRYQVAQHGDEPHKVTRSAFRRFLIDTPLTQQPASGLPTPGGCYGSFHQQYWLDGCLVAVGVVDVLPSCLSSVYLFWDPAIAPLAPGKYSALREIEWIQAASKVHPQLHHYYMGFYIHSCHKMRYKAGYEPSDLLCPASYCWVPFSRVKPALDAAQGGWVALSKVVPGQSVPSSQAAAQAQTAEELQDALRQTTMLMPGTGGAVKYGQILQATQRDAGMRVGTMAGGTAWSVLAALEAGNPADPLPPVKELAVLYRASKLCSSVQSVHVAGDTLLLLVQAGVQALGRQLQAWHAAVGTAAARQLVYVANM